MHQRRITLSVLLGIVLLSFTTLTVQGCTIDQKPSLRVNGALVVLNRVLPKTQEALDRWAPFLTSKPLSHAHALTLSENKTALAAVLTAQALHGPCGWEFGDGTIGYGWTTQHRYKKAGAWVVKVYVWNKYASRWDLFDRVSIVTS